MDDINTLQLSAGNNTFVVFSKPGCPNCTRAKDMIRANGYKFVVHDCAEWLLNDRDGLFARLRTLANNAESFSDGKLYFPIIFHENTFVGSFAQLQNFVHILQVNDVVF